MAKENKDFCFCTLALGKRYRIMARQLAKDIEKYYPETKFVVLTDAPKDFMENKNVLAFKHKQRGIWACYNDKRFVLEKALDIFNAAIFVDSDVHIIHAFNLKLGKGITGNFENMFFHLRKNNPKRLIIIKKIADKIGVRYKETRWIGESLFAVKKCEGRENNFLSQWNIITSYLELKGIHDGEGSVMGLAAEKIGFPINNYKAWDNFRKTVRHMDASDHIKPTKWEFWKKRISYHYRLNKARLLALRDFDFYYR
jgi:hypothetical protein